MSKNKNKESPEIKKRKKELDQVIDSGEAWTDTPKKKKPLPKFLQLILKTIKEKPRAATVTGITMLVIALFGYQQLNKPRLGSMGYGLCKNFLELYVSYPDYLRLSSARDYKDDQGSIVSRIWYSQLDAFGQNRMERIQCYFRRTPQKQLYIDRITIDRREVNHELVKRFNAALDGIKNTELNRDLPKDFPNRIRDLKPDPNFGRTPLL